MTEEKKKRLINALIVGAVVFLVAILIPILTYQTVTRIKLNRRIEFLESEIARYEQLIKEGQDEYALRELREWIEAEARELGYDYSTDKELD